MEKKERKEKKPQMHLGTQNCTKPCSLCIACCYALCPLDGGVAPYSHRQAAQMG